MEKCQRNKKESQMLPSQLPLPNGNFDKKAREEQQSLQPCQRRQPAKQACRDKPVPAKEPETYDRQKQEQAFSVRRREEKRRRKDQEKQENLPCQSPASKFPNSQTIQPQHCQKKENQREDLGSREFAAEKNRCKQANQEWVKGKTKR